MDQAVRSDRLRGRRDHHGRVLGLDEAGPDPFHHLGLGESPFLQVLLEQRVVGLRHGLRELLPERIGLGVDVLGPVALRSAWARLVAVGLLGQQVSEAREVVLLADRELQWCHLGPERLYELVEGRFEGGSFVVLPAPPWPANRTLRMFLASYVFIGVLPAWSERGGDCSQRRAGAAGAFGEAGPRRADGTLAPAMRNGQARPVAGPRGQGMLAL